MIPLRNNIPNKNLNCNCAELQEAEAKLAEWKVACDQHFGRMNSAEKRAAIAEAKLSTAKAEAFREALDAWATELNRKCGWAESRVAYSCWLESQAKGGAL